MSPSSAKDREIRHNRQNPISPPIPPIPFQAIWSKPKLPIIPSSKNSMSRRRRKRWNASSVTQCQMGENYFTLLGKEKILFQLQSLHIFWWGLIITLFGRLSSSLHYTSSFLCSNSFGNSIQFGERRNWVSIIFHYQLLSLAWPCINFNTVEKLSANIFLSLVPLPQSLRFSFE